MKNLPKLIIHGTHDQNTIDQINNCLVPGIEYARLMADGHYGFSVPIGGVVVSKEHLCLNAAGFDIGCGNMAVKTDMPWKSCLSQIDRIMQTIYRSISFGVGRFNREAVDHPLFEDYLWELAPYKDWKLDAYKQLGTVGSGNHYIDIFLDEEKYVWVGVHFGSRGLGHKIATYFMKQAGVVDNMSNPPTLIAENSFIGQDYILGMTLAGKYAEAGREWVVNKVVKDILEANVLDSVHNHHNFVWREKHFGEDYWVGRKGATPIFPNQKSFIGGSMGDDAVIVEGVDSEESRQNFYSTVHGAGRVMSRNQAKGKIKRKTGERISEGQISKQDMKEWLEKKGVRLIGGDVDEAPQAYRRLNEVLEKHSKTFKIKHVLKPIGVAMAGPDIRDPYKD